MTDALVLDVSLINQPLGEFAVAIPGAAAVFRRHKLDYCCGGTASLADAARGGGVDPETILRELSVLIPQERSIPDTPIELIALLVTRYHDVHRRELPELVRIARRVEKVHADHPAVPTGLADILERMERELGEHMQKEERILFPMLMQNNPMAVHPIAMMKAEHLGHGEELSAVVEATHDLELPGDACGSWRALYSGLRKLTDDLTDHIHIENNVLFPQFEAREG